MPSDTTQAVVERHMAALATGDIEALMADYADDAVMISNMGGVTRGVDALRAVFSNVPAAGFSGLEMKSEHYEGNVGYIAWTTAGIALGSDTFVVDDDGKITAQTVVMHFG